MPREDSFRSTIPTATESELCALGSGIIDADATKVLLSRLQPEHFWRQNNPRIFKAIRACAEKHGEVDAALVLQHLRHDGEIVDDGIRDQIFDAVENTPNTGNIEAYCQEVLEAHVRRGLIQEAKNLDSVARNGFTVDKTIQITDRIRDSASSAQPKEVDYFEEAILESRSIRERGIDLDWGSSKLNAVLGGIRRGHLYTMGTKTSHGKTAFAMSVVDHLMSKGKTVVYNGFENLDQVPKRLAAQHYKQNISWFLKPDTCTEYEYAAMDSSLKKLKQDFSSKVKILNSVSMAETRRVVDELKPDLLILDYIQRYATSYISADDGNFVYAIGKAMSDLQDIAIRGKCAVLCLSQFSRRADHDNTRIPEISDLKGSGEIENISDAIILGHWRYRDNPNGKTPQHSYSMHVVKNKLGEIGELFMNIDLDTLKIGD